MVKFGKNIGFITAGYPSLEYTREFLDKLDDSTLDSLEIGIPYSDPIADGKIIFNASFEALKSGVNITTVFELIKNRKSKKPVILLVYFNIIFSFGLDKFVQKCSEIGVSGIIVPDLPFEENKKLFDICQKFELHLIPLVSVTSGHRIEQIISRGSGFVYVVGVVGLTGGAQVENTRLRELVTKVKQITKMPVAVGFGLRNSADIKRIMAYADAAIVGTKIVEICRDFSPNLAMKEIEKIFLD